MTDGQLASAKAMPLTGSEARWLDRHTFLPMMLTAVGGLVLSSSIALSFEHWWCVPHEGMGAIGLCAAIRQNPPWIPLASLASAPSLILTWYWRTSHKKSDLAQKQLELELRKQEQERQLELMDRDRANLLRAQVAEAGKFLTLSPDPQERERNLRTLLQAAEVSSLQEDIASAASVFLKNYLHDEQRPEEFRYKQKRFRQQAIQLICRIANARPEISVDLETADLSDLDLSGLKLRRFNLEKAKLRRARLHGADFTDARLEGIQADDAEYDEETVVGDGPLWLDIGGARKVKKKMQSTGHEPERKND